MPFKSDKQRKLCWMLYNKDIKAGKTPKWDCEEWEEETAKMEAKGKKASRKTTRKSRK